MRHARALCVVVAILAALVSMPVCAQLSGVQGTVVDEEGTPIPAVTVTLRGSSLAAPQVVTTDGNGHFVFPAIPVGRYTVEAAQEGFAVVRTEVTVDFGASASVELSLPRGIPDTITVTSTGGPILGLTRPSWNSWFSKAGAAQGEPVSELRAGGTYDFFLDIARLQWKAAGVSSADVGDDLMAELIRAYEQNELTLGLRVRPVLVGDALEIVADSGRTWLEGSWQPLPNSRGIAIEVRLGNLLDRDGPLPPPETPWMEIADRMRAGGARFAVKAKKRGCSTLVLSILDGEGKIPLDALVRNVAVGGADCGPDSDHREFSAGFVALLRGYAGELDVAGALQLLEMETSTAQSGATVAIYIPEAPVGACAAFTWQTPTTLSYQLFKSRHLATLLAEARREVAGGAGYADVADHLRRALFPPGSGGTHECGRDEALQALRNLASVSEAKMYFTLITHDNQPLFAPIGLLFSLEEERAGARTRFFAGAPRIVQPLARNPYASKMQCIRNWTFILPEEIKGSGPLELPESLQAHSRTKRNLNDLRALFTKAVNSPEALGDEPIGLVLLAHHVDGTLYFDDIHDSVQATELEHAEFPAGSVVLLATCSAGNLQGNLDLVRQLNKAGFGTILLSPFETDVAFGAKLAQIFAETVANAPLQEGPTIAEVFWYALAEAARELGTSGMALEFLLAGAPSVRVCRPPGGDN